MMWTARRSPRRPAGQLPRTSTHGLFALVLGVAIGLAPGAVAAQQAEPAHHVLSTPENIVWGWFPIDREPVLTIRSGETVRIDTLTHAGATQAEDPERYLNQFGVAPEEILQDVIDFWLTRGDRPREGRSAHVITGPIYIEDAEPGDMLEVQILSIETRVPYGINNTAATSGVFSPDYPGSSPADEPMDMEPVRHFIRTAEEDGTEVALFSDDIRIPLAPFMGVMAVAPEAPAVGQPGVDVPGVQGSRPPGPFGGNLDVKDLAAGTTLYLPVFHPGGRFYVGDPHSVQGDGEVSGTAIEQSLTGDFRFVLHKNRQIDGPRAENATHHILMGIDLDLDRALRKAVAATIDFLVEEYGLNRARAYSLASIAVDYRVAEAVDLTQVITAFVPKAIFVDR